MDNETTSQAENPKSWFSDISWKAALILAAIGFVSGGTGGIATKATKAEGLTPEAADVRYLSKDEAERKAAKRDSQLEDLRRSIVTREVFDERTKAIQDEQLRQRQLLEKLLEKK